MILILNELNAAALSRIDAFLAVQISNILRAFFIRMSSLSHKFQANGPDFLGENYSYSNAHDFSLALANHTKYCIMDSK